MSTQKTAVVKSKGEDLGEVTFPQYETVAEAIEALGEEAVLILVNSQVETTARNDFRREKTTGSLISNKALKALLSNVPEENMEALKIAIEAGDRATVALLLQT